MCANSCVCVHHDLFRMEFHRNLILVCLYSQHICGEFVFIHFFLQICKAILDSPTNNLSKQREGNEFGANKLCQFCLVGK
jgi:hypothetical protein